MAKARRQAPPQRLILDAGAVIGLARADVRARAALAAALEANAEASVPAVVVAETVRGGATDAPVNRVLKAIGEIDVADEAIGRTAGRRSRAPDRRRPSTPSWSPPPSMQAVPSSSPGTPVTLACSLRMPRT